MHNIEIPHKNKSLSLFHINECTPNKNFDDLQPWPTKYTALCVTFWREKLRNQFSENLVL